MAEDKNKQNPDELNDEQLDEIAGGVGPGNILFKRK